MVSVLVQVMVQSAADHTIVSQESNQLDSTVDQEAATLVQLQVSNLDLTLDQPMSDPDHTKVHKTTTKLDQAAHFILLVATLEQPTTNTALEAAAVHPTIKETPDSVHLDHTQLELDKAVVMVVMLLFFAASKKTTKMVPTNGLLRLLMEPNLNNVDT